MRREFLLGTVTLALVAAIVTGVLADKMMESCENEFSVQSTYLFVAFLPLMPLSCGAITLVLPGRRGEWMPFIVVAGAAALAMALAVGQEVVNSSVINDATKVAARTWYGVMAFGTGMLIPLAVALGHSERERRARERGSEAATIEP
jgi:hypothetical protein